MKVYVVLYWEIYEGDYIVKVFSSKEGAEAFLQKEENLWPEDSSSGYKIVEYEVD